MREDLIKKMDELVDKIVKGSASKKATRALIEETLNLQKQLDVVAVELDIPAEDVVKRYQVDETMEVVKCRNCIYFHATLFWVVVKPTMADNGGSLYETLSWFCDYQDNRDTMSEAERETGDTYCTIILHMLALPRDLFFDTSLCIDIASYVITKRADYYTKLLEQAPRAESSEDIVENQRFEDGMRLAEELTKSIKEGL